MRALRRRFLAPGNPYGCAESVLLTLQEQFGLPDPTDGAAAMALNGGIAYSGGTCGAATGAAIALGRLAHARVRDRSRAKRIARELTAIVIDDMRAADGAIDCRTLIGIDLQAPGAHEAFLAAGTWRRECLRRLERVVDRLAPLAVTGAWIAAVKAMDADTSGRGASPATGAARRRPEEPVGRR
jgi:C_GCAxxG_C_C family probable redox protein